ncbi:glycosyl transferase family 1, partial [Pauljensenia sp. UMB3104]|nr:glycosyl transferase family 1 [Pauljensenia sp. UMB3104]
MKPGAYDYAYPTKILSSLSAGTPVIFAGPGQAALDVAEANLGCAVDVDVDAVCDAMVELSTLDDNDPRC